MRNGQLKAGYNVQLAVNSEYITGIDVFSNRTDVGTLRPFLRKLELAHKQRYEEVTADAGYESLENYLYLEANGQTSFIKPTNYEAQKTKKFRSQIGRIENMKYDEHEDCYICAQGRKLRCRKVSTELSQGIPVTKAWYRCEDCRNCPQREKCCRKQDVNAPKEIIRQETFWEKRKVSQENITSERGILLQSSHLATGSSFWYGISLGGIERSKCNRPVDCCPIPARRDRHLFKSIPPQLQTHQGLVWHLCRGEAKDSNAGTVKPL